MKHLDPHRSDLAKFVSIWLIMIAPREFGTTTDLLWSTKYIEISIISLVCIVIRKILHGWSTIPFMWILFFANNSEYYDGLWPKKNKPPRSKHDFGEGMLPSNLSLPAKTMEKKNKQTALWINRITPDVVLRTDLLCIRIDAIRTVDHPRSQYILIYTGDSHHWEFNYMQVPLVVKLEGSLYIPQQHDFIWFYTIEEYHCM
jgi:hypothetical protein